MDRMTENRDLHWMQLAMEMAQKAEALGEVPVGAVLVKDDQLIACGWNQPIAANDPCAHAEILCLRQAGSQLENYRLLDTTLYVTLEPCAMCAGAMVHARVGRLVYGAADPKTGAAGSVLDLVRHPLFNHKLAVSAGVMEQECSEQLSAFFRRRRQEQKALKQARKLNLPAAEN
ncbi:tRNA adenosine(34) deaminase TadA [Shewanella algae]|nr:tRNA adenosine(34) deaminase TadA [Shewanella algae]MBO2623966.1 tRNA adenosine(34) deaminase TadA [Shewanella algae]QXP18314.1 tRNA adenosine(34) deaminase TadA [Shewanella algae]QXP31606.1 tRNA adenosine(34) deaminase TadA [Shewanella algae]QXP35135.1 tRNA adenosine(34) deaminase TadA [Shewanella algae]QXP37053.1 tRNA adenosine(34) deaminase TadA [Shewanella algae]